MGLGGFPVIKVNDSHCSIDLSNNYLNTGPRDLMPMRQNSPTASNTALKGDHLGLGSVPRYPCDLWQVI